jgi:hypothetical protein
MGPYYGDRVITWKHKIDIKPIVESYQDDELDFTDMSSEVRRVADALVVELKKHVFIPEGIVRNLEVVHTESGFNRTLKLLYEYCDEHRIWLGGL